MIIAIYGFWLPLWYLHNTAKQVIYNAMFESLRERGFCLAGRARA
jgi:hypothetical protein